MGQSAQLDFDAIVVGSGFGGSVMAMRLASDGKRVCVLERGRCYPPGSFARTPLELRRNFWNPDKGTYGLFDVWSFKNIESIVSAGLGGGSLIYANVLIRKDEEWFVTDINGSSFPWPITRACLDRHYDKVEKVLKPQIFPDEYLPGSKTLAMREAAEAMDIDETPYWDVENHHTVPQFYRPLLAVTFANQGRSPHPGVPIEGGENNLHEMPRFTCRLCGECDVGCNYGSKNTLDYTYLSEAKNAGADIRSLCNVKTIERLSIGGRDSYRVGYVVYDTDNRTRSELQYLTARRLILACGALGTTLLLLRNKPSLPGLSEMLGTRFCGNGDYLAFVRNASRPGNGRRIPVDLRASHAPVITSTFRFPDDRDTPGSGRGRYVQDAGYPVLGDYIWELLEPFGALRRFVSFFYRRVVAALTGGGPTEIGGALETLVGRAIDSSATMPLLGMGRDTPNGRLTLGRDGKLLNSWTTTASRPYIRAVETSSKDIASKLGGSFFENPITKEFNRLITVHPLGGCPMGNDRSDGVVDSYGNVFDSPGLYVVDGSVMPGPVGANPSMTIAAFAERCAERMLTTWVP